MNQVSIMLPTLIIVVVSFFAKDKGQVTITAPTQETEGTCDCQCNPQMDSTILMELYWSAGGPNWKESWDPAQPYLEWEVDSRILDVRDGCVFALELQQNDLNGELPESIGGLCRLKKLLLYENGEFLGGPIPASIGNLCNLEQLNLNGNNFSGSVPAELVNCTKLQELSLSENQFSGSFPDLSSLPLRGLDISDNLIKAFPSHAAIESWGSQFFEGCRIEQNLLSFDDIIPNLDIGNQGVWWSFEPQKKLYKDTTFILHAGESTTARLDFDSIVSPVNTYKWYKNGVIYRTLTDNRIPFTEVTEEDEGSYHCEITNSTFDSGTILSTHTIQLKVCQATFEVIQVTLCGGQDTLIHGMEFRTAGEYEIELNNAEGCDSTIFLELSILDANNLGYADAGPDQFTCEEETQLAGSFPDGPYMYTGRWTDLSNGNSSPLPDWSPRLAEGENVFLWTIATDRCPAHDTDTLVVWRSPKALAIDDTLFYSGTNQVVEISVLNNDILPEGVQWNIDLSQFSSSLPVTIEQERRRTIIVNLPRLAAGELSFQYELCNEACDECSTATVYLLPKDPSQNQVLSAIPDAISPNGDNLNDRFVIPAIEYAPERYPNNELIIQNRRGVTVYYASPYDNSWEGTARDGSPLPTDNYRYFIKLNEKYQKRGNLLIVRER